MEHAAPLRSPHPGAAAAAGAEELLEQVERVVEAAHVRAAHAAHAPLQPGLPVPVYQAHTRASAHTCPCGHAASPITRCLLRPHR